MKVSVLVPVYGVEKYIRRCVESLFNQTYADLEFVFVDDCSPDRSIDILRSVIYPELDVSVQRFAELFALILDTMTEEENEYLYSVNKRGRRSWSVLKKRHRKKKRLYTGWI